jgi:hypothetical protein
MGETVGEEKTQPEVPDDAWKAFAFFVGKCAEGFGKELLEQGKTDTQARNAVIGCLLDFAAGEACRITRREGRDPDPAKWLKATQDAFERAVMRTMAQPPSPQPDPEAR